MDFEKIWESIVAFFNEGYNLYYVIGGAILLLVIIISAVAASKAKKRKSVQEEETVAAVAPAPVAVKRAAKPSASIQYSAPVSVDKPPVAPKKPIAKQDNNTKVAIMTPTPPAQKPDPAKSELPPTTVSSSPEKEENEKIEESLKRPGLIQIYKDNGERYRFRIKASNSYIVGHSQGYTTKYACKNGIAAIAKMIDAETIDTTKQDYKPTIGRSVFEVYRDNENKFRFRLRAANTNNILASQGYTTKENCINGIRSIKHIILNHILQDTTLTRS